MSEVFRDEADSQEERDSYNDPEAWWNNLEEEDDRYAEGFKEGFSRAREIFWRDFMRRAGEAKMLNDSTKESLGHGLESFAITEAAYRNCADMVSRGHTLYPGASSGEDRGYNELYKY